MLSFIRVVCSWCPFTEREILSKTLFFFKFMACFLTNWNSVHAWTCLLFLNTIRETVEKQLDADRQTEKMKTIKEGNDWGDFQYTKQRIMCLNYQNKNQTIVSKSAQSATKPGKKEEQQGNAEETWKNISNNTNFHHRWVAMTSYKDTALQSLVSLS